MCVMGLISIVAADALVLKHQVISIHNTDSIYTVSNLFHIFFSDNSDKNTWNTLNSFGRKMTQ